MGLFASLSLTFCGAVPPIVQGHIEEVPGPFAFSGSRTLHPALFAKAGHYLSTEQAEKAEAIYRELIEIEPSNEDARISLGSSLFLQERYDEALAAYKEASHMAPESVEATIGQATIARATGDLENSLNLYSKAINLDESNADAHWGKAVTLALLGRMQPAIAHLERVLELAPETALADQAQAKIDELEAAAGP
jgi:tetratricopeptide (TPR) repeat protein